MEKVGDYLKEDLAKPGYKSTHESTKRWSGVATGYPLVRLKVLRVFLPWGGS